MADKWLFLKVIEFLFVLSCLIAKRVTDDEEFRLFLYLQKLSREWSLLNSVTWDRVGSAVADAVYGGYLIITFGMILGRALKELPSKKRAMERFFLGIGAILFVILGSLEFAALDSIPPDLLDNAAVLGTLSILTGILFLIDMSAPRLKASTKQSQTSAHLQLRPLDIPANGIDNLTTNGILVHDGQRNGQPRKGQQAGKVMHNGNGVTNGIHVIHKTEVINKQQQKPKKAKKFDIFGHDKDDDIAELAERMEKHSPVFSRTQKAQYGQYDNMSPTYLRFHNEIDSPDKPPSTPGDPGYVQYTAKRWGQEQQSQKTPRNSPTDV